jgi:hypothetical protein
MERRMHVLRRYALLFASASVVVALACGDYKSPTDPAALRLSDGGSNNFLDPVYVTAPYTYWCIGGWSASCYDGGGQYIAPLSHSQVSAYCRDKETSQYCNFDVGGGDGYNDANPYHGDQLDDGQVNAVPRPDCSQVQSDQRVRMWCKGDIPQPGSARHTHLQNAINKIKARASQDEYCGTIGDEAQRLLDGGWIRIYPKDSMPLLGGFAPTFKHGTDDSYIAISSEWTDLAFDDNHAKSIFGNKVTLQLILSHELSHLWGISGHLSESTAGKLFTTFTERCSGQGPPVNT